MGTNGSNNIGKLNLGNIRLIVSKHAAERASERGLGRIPASLPNTIGMVTGFERLHGQFQRVWLAIEGRTYIIKPIDLGTNTWIAVTSWATQPARY